MGGLNLFDAPENIYFSKISWKLLSNPKEYTSIVKGISNANLTSAWGSLAGNKRKKLNNFCFYFFMAILFSEFPNSHDFLCNILDVLIIKTFFCFNTTLGFEIHTVIK